MTEVDPRGRFVWHELMTTDAEAAINFYPTVTGWGVMPFPENPSYRMWTNNGVPHGGILAVDGAGAHTSVPPHWLPYVAVKSVDASAANAVQLGGSIAVQPTDIPMVGRYAVVADPQGALLAIFQTSGTMPGHEGPAEVGEFSWHELMTSDWAAAWRFYSTLFGWKETSAMDMGPDGKYQMYGRNGVELGGMYNKPANVPGGPRWLSYVRVASRDKAAAHTRRLGGMVMMEMEVPGGNIIATCADGQGVAFALHEQREVVAAAAKPAAKTKAKSEPKAKAKAKPKSKPKLKPKAKSKAKPKAKSKAKPKAKSKAKPKARKKAKAKK